MKFYLFVALVATSLFACNKENGESQVDNETKTVTLTIKSVENIGSKAAEIAGIEHKTRVQDFTTYFINSTGGVVDKRNSPDSVTDTTYVFEKVSGLASQIFIVANTELTKTDISGSTLTALKGNILKIINYQKGIDNVIMAPFDAADIIAKSGEAGKYKAAVTIAPVVARLEIVQIEAVAVGGGAPIDQDVTAFTVANIYVNAYDSTKFLIGDAIGRITGTTANFTKTDLKDTGINIASVDKKAVPVPVPVPVPPITVWAYQLFAGAAPTMVIQFSSITFANGSTITDKDTPANELCITVTAFDPSAFAAAKIYNVDNIQFSSKNIGKPYEATKNITVTLSVQEWEIVPTTVTLQ